MNALSVLPTARLVPTRLAPPLAVLIEPSDGLCSRVADLLATRGYRVCIANGVTDDLDRAALAVVEADRASRAIGLIRRIHARQPDLVLVGVLPWWTDDEVDILDAARYVLHVPIRDDQLRGLEELAAAVLVTPAAC
jgi:hypothetical protein